VYSGVYNTTALGGSAKQEHESNKNMLKSKNDRVILSLYNNASDYSRPNHRPRNIPRRDESEAMRRGREIHEALFEWPCALTFENSD